jgi:hypothetical protein
MATTKSLQPEPHAAEANSLTDLCVAQTSSEHLKP